MSLSKRQQARNERTLQELIKSVPGNDACADCQARNPGECQDMLLKPLLTDVTGWASWSVSRGITFGRFSEY